MKILFCSNEQMLPLLGGGSAGNLRIIEKMVARGHQVTVTTPLFMPKEPIEQQYGIKLKPFSPFYIHRTVRFRELKYSAYVVLFSFHLLKLVRKESFDCIFVRNCIIAAPALLAGRIWKIPVFISMTDIITGFLQQGKHYPRFMVDILMYFERLFASMADELFVITPAMQREALKGTKRKPNKVCISYDGVDTNLFNPHRINAEDVSALKQRLGLSGKIAMYHGVIDPYHGIDALERILDIALANTDLSFLIIAKGPGYSRLQAKYNSSRVKLLDFVPYEQIPLYIAASDVGFIPYKPNYNLNVVLTLKLLEYLAMGLPVVTLPLKSVQEIFAGYRFVSIAQNEEQFVDELAQRAGEGKMIEATELMRQRFSWERMTDLMVTEIENYVAKADPV